MEKVFVIIVTYNGMLWIERCLLSLRESTSVLSTIVIDNGSTDGTQEFIKTTFPEVRIEVSKTNLGFGAANNRAVSLAINEGATHVFLLNQDTHIYKDTIDKLLKIYQMDNRLAVLSPLHLNDTGTRLDMNFESYINFKKCPNYISDLSLDRVKQFYEIEFVNAAAWLIDVRIIKKIGLFSEIFFHYGEDSNFTQRLLYFNYKCAIVPDTFIHHYREERKGKKTKEYLKRERHIKMLAIILNVNRSYKDSYLIVVKLAISRLVAGETLNFLKLLFLPLLNWKAYSRIRRTYKEPNGLGSI